MSINLLEIAKDHFSDAVIEKISSSLGLDPNMAQGIIGKVFPALMGSFGEKAQTPEGATQLFDVIKDSDDGMLGNLTQAFTGDNSEIIENGQGLLSSLFGGKLDSLTDILGSVPGLSTAKAGGLLGLLAPMLAGILKKQVVSGGLNASGLTSLLDDQKEYISASLGDDFLSKLGLGALFGGAPDKVAGVVSSAAGALGGAASCSTGSAKDLASDAACSIKGAAGSIGRGATSIAGSAASTATETTQKAGGGLLKLLPILILGLLAFLAIKMCKKSDLGNAASDTVKSSGSILGDLKDGVADIGNKAADAAGNAASTVADTADSATNTISDTAANTVNTLTDTANNAVNTAVETTSEAANTVARTAGNAANTVAETSGNAAHAVIDTASHIADGVKDTTGAAVNGITPLGSKANNTATDITETAAAEANGIKKRKKKARRTDRKPAPKFVPTPDADQLSEKAAKLAQRLSSVKVPEGRDIDSLYEKIGARNNSQFLYRIPFATGETGVPNSHQKTLIAKLKEANPAATLVTIGYADVRGDDALNKKLSYGRAKEVGAWIKSTLGNDQAIESFSMGETDRFSKEDFSKNRAVEVWQIK